MYHILSLPPVRTYYGLSKGSDHQSVPCRQASIELLDQSEIIGIHDFELLIRVPSRVPLKGHLSMCDRRSLAEKGFGMAHHGGMAVEQEKLSRRGL